MEDRSEEDKREMTELLRAMGEAAEEAINMPEEQLSEEGSSDEKQLLEEQVFEEQQVFEAGPVAGLKRKRDTLSPPSALPRGLPAKRTTVDVLSSQPEYGGTDEAEEAGAEGLKDQAEGFDEE
ncbi:hypothetical protein LTR56_022498 [Elasticomyces elasticus]|nr:hypothetical protein LTR56_022498 [Elasticomyces elasticus]KAK3632047.1 hypothetical protein LTR22_020787 [Elasticomyces elasticus]KAK4910052.1 hypothetical protein LTR49_021250 [Elasticomyces elasticus]KAK5749406.1 hypothetical protein LTS12_020516 [Elasticomyces elasticus]